MAIGSTAGIVVGVGLGTAASAAFEPALEIPKQEAWRNDPHRILDVGLLARLVAQGGVDLADAQFEAAGDGYAPDKLDALIYLEQTAPGSGEALALWRLGLLSDSLFEHALTKAGLDPRFAAAIVARKTAEKIGLGDVATAIVRGAVPAPAWVPVAPPSTTDNVPRFPVTNLDPVALAAALGYDEDMLRIMTARSGLSLAPILATQALFRGKLTPNDWLLAIAEGDLRTEWAETLREAAREILTADQYMESALRGWRTLEEAKALAAKHGMVEEDAQLLYQIRRRPLGIHAITTALAKGGQFDTTNSPYTDPYVAYVHEADLGPEWYDLAEANKYSPPSAFVIRALLRDGVYTVEHGTKRLLQTGIFPEDAALIAQHYGAQSTTTGDPHVTKAQGQLWTTTHRSYIAAESDDATATTALEAAGVSTASVPAVLALWAHERELVRKQLTPAQIKKAYSTSAINAETTLAWTRDEALAALIARGYSPTDADSFLNI